MTDGLALYIKQIKEHTTDYYQQLQELTKDYNKGDFKQRDYRAAERLLQLYTEACTGIAKHLNKHYLGIANSEAYQAFKYLAEKGVITQAELAEWRLIIGMRNSLVHDYLNLDLQIVGLIIAQQKYQTLKDFVEKAIPLLEQKS
ncbi:type VII toxin-antitoxin system HepT family RNase toxin [Catenovulum agarivorans]|uniref:type VII toxin-antitoxin system HepT family RNase toxin n=1 Tax=Catenovulum agarivorans TaxID=1172192 RepID=UPI0004B21081|nr:DUF86 domain-containing protein [Catenovulum agarivorans]